MAKIVWDVSASLDGFTAGPGVSDTVPMGVGGERLHEWMGGDTIDVAVHDAVNASVGAAVVGRRTYDLGLPLWGGTPWAGVPAFVVTHRSQPDFVGDNGGTFAFGNVRDAVERSRLAAGDKNVIVLGADVARQLLKEGHLDEVHLHLVPILLGGGTKLFDGDLADLVPHAEPIAGTVTHLRYRIKAR